jgi:hypothetical protein
LLRRSFDHAVGKIIKIDRSTNPVKDDEAGGMFWLDRIEQQAKRTDDGNPPRLMDVFFRRVPNTATDGEHVFAIIIRWGCSGVSMTLKATLESNDFVFAKNPPDRFRNNPATAIVARTISVTL